MFLVVKFTIYNTYIIQVLFFLRVYIFSKFPNLYQTDMGEPI